MKYSYRNFIVLKQLIASYICQLYAKFVYALSLPTSYLQFT